MFRCRVIERVDYRLCSRVGREEGWMAYPRDCSGVERERERVDIPLKLCSGVEREEGWTTHP